MFSIQRDLGFFAFPSSPFITDDQKCKKTISKKIVSAVPSSQKNKNSPCVSAAGSVGFFHFLFSTLFSPQASFISILF